VQLLAEPQLFEDIKLYDPAFFSALDTKKSVTTPSGNPLVFTLSDKRINAAAAQFEQVGSPVKKRNWANWERAKK
jgi:hypothetical protein